MISLMTTLVYKLVKAFLGPIFTFFEKIDQSGEMTEIIEGFRKNIKDGFNLGEEQETEAFSTGDDFDSDFDADDFGNDFDDEEEEAETLFPSPKLPGLHTIFEGDNQNFAKMPKQGQKKTNIGKDLWDDRENDWLAKQLREEARIYRNGLGLDLGASHEQSCDAGLIKKAHHARHMKANAANAGAKALKKAGF